MAPSDNNDSNESQHNNYASNEQRLATIEPEVENNTEHGDDHHQLVVDPAVLEKVKAETF